MQLFIKRVERDDVLIASLEADVAAFLAEVSDTVGQLQAAYPEALAVAA
jgi:hypothetical protein